MQGSALPVLWQHPLSIYHSHTHQPNFQLQEAHEDSPAAGSHSASVHGRPEMPGNDASQEQRSTCDGWELVSDYPSSLPSGELSDVQLKLMAHRVSFSFLFYFPTSIPTSFWDHPLKSTCTQILIPGSASGKTKIKVLTVCRIAHTY